jgi:hypothetical protein
MTLGRTSSGAIKIKTDEAGGGLRAVECACCGGCDGCGTYDFSKILSMYFVDPSGMSFFDSFTFDCQESYIFDINGNYELGDIYISRGSRNNQCGMIIGALLYESMGDVPCEAGLGAGLIGTGEKFIPDDANGPVDIKGDHTFIVNLESTYCCSLPPEDWYVPDACPYIRPRNVTVHIETQLFA